MAVLVALCLAGAAWFGHAFLLTVILNVIFSVALPRRWLKRIRATIALLVFGFPFVLALVYARRLLAARDEPAALVDRPAVFGYLCVCWFTTIVYLPIVSAIRALRRWPKAVAISASRVEDVAARLGEQPVGTGRYWRLSRLPGNQCFQVELLELTIRLPGLPAEWDGLTILHLTDLHFCGSPGREFYARVMDLCMAAGPPDILAITGDVVDSHHHHKWVVPIFGRLKWNVAAYAILGNHDKYHDPVLVRRRLRRLGVRVVGNGWEQIDVRGRPLLVIGNETPWFVPGPRPPAGGGAEPFRLCLSHTPDHLRWAARNGIDLMLAGHVHGGQVRLPLIGPLFCPSRYSRRFDCGAFAAGPTVMYVGRGLAGGEPLRYNCRPEVTRIVLRPDR
jgi:predicted MPP superfamily phosphohydrolase